jgi:REP element-mobilizing transposase RayT
MGRRGRTSLVSETLYFVTTTVVNFARVFTQDKYCDILVNNIKHYQRKYQFTVFGYVIMPTHFHWIVQVNPALGHISEIVRDIKKYSAWELFDALESDKRFGLLAMFSREASSLPDQHRKFWIRRFDDEAIRNSGMLRAKLEYIHYNPVKAELVRNPEDYKYSSARNYMVGDHSILEVRTDWF